ncbi:MAG: response regulator [Candidatus Promineifilaceae bacterium]|nr:response regulator [Candidatus Promineifilaceae bacterium]
MKKILIVEDVELNTDLLVQLLEDEYELQTAVDGQEGVAKAEQNRPDLILMDMSLPVMDGYEATRAIKANPELANIIIIGLSAHAMSGDREKAIAAGCDDYLTKPLNDDLLFDMLDEYLGG